MASNRRSKLASAASTVGREPGTDYKRIHITVFRNGDPHDAGTYTCFTRRQFPRWTTFLDFLTGKLHLTEGAVNSLYTVLGEEVRTFCELKSGQCYVGVHNRFRPISYGGEEARQSKPCVPAATKQQTDDWEHHLKKRSSKTNLAPLWDNSQSAVMKTKGQTRVTITVVPPDPVHGQRRSEMFQRPRSAEGINSKQRYKSHEGDVRGNEKINKSILKSGQSMSYPGVQDMNRLSIRRMPDGRFSNQKNTDRNNSKMPWPHTGYSTQARIPRPSTATLFFNRLHASPRRTAAEAAKRMQWNLRPETETPIRRTTDGLKYEQKRNMYTNAEVRLARMEEDRAYEFYERQKELELKRETMERAFKGNLKFGNNATSAAGTRGVISGCAATRSINNCYARSNGPIDRKTQNGTTVYPPIHLPHTEKRQLVKLNNPNGPRMNIPPIGKTSNRTPAAPHNSAAPHQWAHTSPLLLKDSPKKSTSYRNRISLLRIQ